jgi:hypothetical protein
VGTPFLFVVNEDPTVREALAGDLGRRFGADYQIQRRCCAPVLIRRRDPGHPEVVRVQARPVGRPCVRVSIGVRLSRLWIRGELECCLAGRAWARQAASPGRGRMDQRDAI